MNTKILQKCLDELKKEQPNVDYIRGMLETLVEMGDQVVVTRAVVEPVKESSIAFNDSPTVKAEPDATKPKAHPTHGLLTMETPEERVARLGRHKVPPAFLGKIENMQVDPSTKVDGNV